MINNMNFPFSVLNTVHFSAKSVADILFFLMITFMALTSLVLIYHWIKYANMGGVTLGEGEKLVKVVRRHYLVMAPIVLILLLAAFLPSIFYYVLTSHFLPLDQNIKITSVALILQFTEWKIFGYSIWLLILWMIFFVEWTDYYLDMLVVTNKRIVDVDQKGFFNREVTNFLYAQIQDITVDTDGFLKTILKFGNLHIQTAGHNHEIVVNSASNPEEVRSLILKLQESNVRPSGL